MLNGSMIFQREAAESHIVESGEAVGGGSIFVASPEVSRDRRATDFGDKGK